MAICKNRLLRAFTLIGILILNFKLVISYEKTLRKIVRNQYKIVKQPFGENQGQILNKTTPNHQQFVYLGNGLMKTTYHKAQWPKLSTYLSMMESPYTKSFSKSKLTKGKPNEFRITRNSIGNVTPALHKITENILFNNPDVMHNTSSVHAYINQSNLQNSFPPPMPSRFFPPMDYTNTKVNNPKVESENAISLTSAENFYQVVVPSSNSNEVAKENKVNEEKLDLKENTIIIPFEEDSNKLLVKSIYTANIGNDTRNQKFKKINNPTIAEKLELDTTNSDDQADFILPYVKDLNILQSLSYNTSSSDINCHVINDIKTDIDALEVFSKFDIEPPWIARRHYWDSIFDSRYQSLLRNPKWPHLKVILIPRTHVDSMWKKSFEQYHNNTVNKILSNIVKKLQYYQNLTFNWNEVSHLSSWWKTAPLKTRSAFRRLLKSGRLEITTGGWVEPDEATSHVFGLIHQLMEGHQWLKNKLNYVPNVAWLSNSVTHSSTMTYLLSASGISKLIFTNLHYSWEHYLSEFQLSDFIWQPNWDRIETTSSYLNKMLNRIGNDRYTKHAVLTHYLQFNSAGIRACGPSASICRNEFDFAKPDKNLDINSYNIKEKAEILLEQYSKTGTLTSHNVIVAPIGGPYRYESQAEFDYQFNNYQKILEYINFNREIYKATLEFGTPSTYFNSIVKIHKSYPTLKGDFLNFADINSAKPAYWTGFYTSRPLFKILIRRLQSTLRTTEILFSFATSFNAFRRYNASELIEFLVQARETVARLMDRNVVSGTLSINAIKEAHKQILVTAKNCWFIQEVSASLLSSKPNHVTPYLQKYVYRDGEFISVFRTVSPGDQLYVFNALSHTRTEVVELVSRRPNIRIVDHNKKDITIQINPVWRYNSKNVIKISRTFFKISFAIIIPPLTLELFKIKETYDATQNAATLYCLDCVIDDITTNSSVFPFTIQPLKEGDIQLESYKHRLIFDEYSGFLKTVVEKETNIEKNVMIDFGAFKSSDSGGMFVFDTDFPKPIHDVLLDYKIGAKSKIVFIITGHLETQLITVYGRLLKHSAKIYNLFNNPLSNAIYITTKVDYDISPKNRELELFISIQTEISNGYPPQIYTDNNGFHFTSRVLNITRRIESNIYPITTMAFIEDTKSRLTFITDHAHGVTALQEGQIVALLDRRVLYNDGKGTNEGLADSSATYHRHIILLENFNNPLTVKRMIAQNYLVMPSLIALHLADYHNYLLDMFIINKYQTEFCYYAFLPLVKASWPCDISLINYRVDLNKDSQYSIPVTALMVIHKRSFSCQIDHSSSYCNADAKFSLDSILHSVKAVFVTNLAGTQKGNSITYLNEANFLPMEILTLRIYF